MDWIDGDAPQEEDEQNIPTTVWEGSFVLFGVEIKCAVLDNGQRIITAESVAAMFEGMERNEPINLGELERFTEWQCAK